MHHIGSAGHCQLSECAAFPADILLISDAHQINNLASIPLLHVCPHAQEGSEHIILFWKRTNMVLQLGSRRKYSNLTDTDLESRCVNVYVGLCVTSSENVQVTALNLGSTL